MNRSPLWWSAGVVALVAMCLVQTTMSAAASPLSLKLSRTTQPRLISRAFVSFRTMHDVQTRSRAMLAKAKQTSREMPVRMGMSEATFRRAQQAAAHNARAPVAPGTFTAAAIAARPNLNGQTGAASFEGMANSGFICPFFGTGCAPPDMALAAGPQHVVQVVNTSVSAYDPAVQSEELGWPLDANSFLGGAPATLLAGCDPFGPFMSDPRAFYDAATGHYWVSILQVDGIDLFGDSCNDMSVDWIAVSKDSNPNDGFFAYGFDVTTSRVDLTDYPRLGYDDGADLVEASFNDFSFVNGGYDGNGLLYLEKAGMEAGTGPAHATQFGGIICNDPRCEGDSNLDTIQPVETIASGVQDPKMLYNVASINFGANGGNGCGFPNPCGHVVTFAILNPFSAPSIAFDIPPTAGYALPPAADVATFGGPCIQCVETLDNRISAMPVYSPGHHSITWALETGLFNGTQVVPGVLWVEESVGSSVAKSKIEADVRQQGYVAGRGDLAVSFGATMKDGGDVDLLVDLMGGTVYPSTLYLEHNSTDPPGTFSEQFLLRAGTGVDIFDGRWGDYEATSWDGHHVWVASQFINGGGDWDTQIARSGH